MFCPVDYSLCRQQVTLYRLTGDTVTRRVVDGVYYQYETAQVADETGIYQKQKFLLIVPGDDDIQIGDRVYPGTGPQISKKQWTGFLPVHNPGLNQVQYVTPRYFMGTLCHTEAGRR